MSFAFNSHHCFFLLKKKLHFGGQIHIHNKEYHTDFPDTVRPYTPALRDGYFVHISAAMDSENSEGTVCVISEGPQAALFSWGCNLHSQQKAKPRHRRSNRLSNEDFDQVYCGHPIRRGRNEFHGETPVSSACTRSSILVVTAEGGLWYTGKCPIAPEEHNLPTYDNPVPTLIPCAVFANTKIKQIAAGCNHLVAVCKEGFLWTWGSNNFDELGIETDNKLITTPIKLDNMLYGGYLMQSVSAGDAHSAAVSVEGRCFQWGRIHAEDNMCLSQPCMTAELPGVHPEYIISQFQKVCCGHTFTLCLDTRGRVWSQGSGPSGELGLGRTSISNKPQLIYGFPQHDRVTQISCGRFNSGAITASGDVYVWGRQYGNFQENTVNSSRSLSEYDQFDNSPMCIKKIHRFTEAQELTLLTASLRNLDIDHSPISMLPPEILQNILRPHEHM